MVRQVTRRPQFVSFAAFEDKLTSPLTTKGDLLTRNLYDHIRLGVGPDGYTLIADSSQESGLKWAEFTESVSIPLDEKGDLLTYNGTELTKLSVGSNGLFLTADSTQPTGLRWTSSGSVALVEAFQRSWFGL